MDGISDKDKLGMAALIASMNEKSNTPLPRPRPKNLPKPQPKPAMKRKKITAEDIRKGRVSPGDANDEMMLDGFKNGGMIDRAAIRGKTRGKIC